MDSQRTIGLAEAAARLRLPYQSAHRLVLVGALEGMKAGGRWIVSLQSLEQYERDLQEIAARCGWSMLPNSFDPRSKG
jgi:hypothetical protein